jgi:hypothetical protein
VIGFVNVLNVMEKVNYPSTKLAAHYVAKTDIYLNAELFIQSPVRTWIMSALMNFSPPIVRNQSFLEPLNPRTRANATVCRFLGIAC